MAIRTIGLSVVVSLGLLAPSTALAQTAPPPSLNSAASAELYELVLKDGSRVYGTVEKESATEVVFRTQSGATLTARREEIASLRLVTGRIENGEFIRSDLHRTRLFFAPTGRALQRGEVSLGVFQFVAPFVQVGVTDRFSIGGGTPLIFGIDDWNRPFWVTPKLQVVNTRNIQASAGLLHVFDADGDGGGIAYGVGTFGSTDNALTVGGGLGYSGDSRTGLIMVGGEGRASRSIKLMTENYFWKNGEGILSGGIRFLGERLSADLALAVPIGFGELIALPVVNFVYVF